MGIEAQKSAVILPICPSIIYLNHRLGRGGRHADETQKGYPTGPVADFRTVIEKNGFWTVGPLEASIW